MCIKMIHKGYTKYVFGVYMVFIKYVFGAYINILVAFFQII